MKVPVTGDLMTSWESSIVIVARNRPPFFRSVDDSGDPSARFALRRGTREWSTIERVSARNPFSSPFSFAGKGKSRWTITGDDYGGRG